MDFGLGKSYRELKIGDKTSFTKTITETDVYLFVGISGDFSPMNVNNGCAWHSSGPTSMDNQLRKGKRWLYRLRRSLSHYLAKRVI